MDVEGAPTGASAAAMSVEEELQQLRYERERLQQLYNGLIVAHDEDLAREDEEHNKINELSVRFRAGTVTCEKARAEFLCVFAAEKAREREKHDRDMVETKEQEPKKGEVMAWSSKISVSRQPTHGQEYAQHEEDRGCEEMIEQANDRRRLVDGGKEQRENNETPNHRINFQDETERRRQAQDS